MTRATLVCDGVVSVTVDGSPTCSVAWLLQPAAEPFDVSQIDSAIVGEAFGVGFFIVASVWLMGWGIRVVLSLLK